jgi:SAM-dependent methyltransferase
MMNILLLWLGVLVVVALLAFGVVLIVFLIASVRNSSPAVMTPPIVLEAIVKALELPESGLVVDMGCGDGRVLEAALKAQRGLRGQGVDNNPVLALMAKVRLRDHCEVKLGDVRAVDLRPAKRVFMYLSGAMAAELEPKLEQELKPGAKVVSMHYRLPHREPVREVEVAGAPPHARWLYIYEY